MIADKKGPMRKVRIDPLRPGSMQFEEHDIHVATFYGGTDANCRFAVAAWNEKVKRESEGG